MTKRITIHFKHPELWNDFTEKITNQYGTTRVHRTEQLEKLLKGYINNDDLQHELEETKQNYERVKQDYEKTSMINEQLTEENQRLQKYTENNDNNMDDLKQTQKNNMELIQQLQHQIQQQQHQIQNLQKQLDEKDDKILKITESNNEVIQQLENKNTSKDNDYKHIVEVNNKLQSEYNELQNDVKKYSYAIGCIENMSFMDRLLNRLPEEIKELKP